MCGLVGIYSRNGGVRFDERLLLVMRDTMITRGPDDAGSWLKKGAAVDVGLAHRRLAILDLSERGRQPMMSADGRFVLAFNGEIFNFAELRAELKATGRHVFNTQTDTEVILHALEAWGLERALSRFRGMYAFAVFDCSDNSLALVRDPLGVKPLYYRETREGIVFASEIKAILAHPDIPRALDARSLNYYLTFANAPAPRTMFEGISKLEAGCYLKFGADGQRQHVRYWDPRQIQPLLDLDEGACTEELLRRLRQAVARRMVSDVPFGVFLSGGVDSSLNVALMAELMDRPVQTYSVGIRGDAANEFDYARKVARAYGADHHEVQIGQDDFIRFFDRMAYIQDEPLADPVCVPLYYLSKLARDTGTLVVQVGEGSDEIFGGYGMYHRFTAWDRLAFQRCSRFPAIARRALYRMSRGIGNPALHDASRRAVHGDPLFIGNAVAFWDSEKQALLKVPLPPEWSASRLIRDLGAGIASPDALLRIINVELQNRLPELLLMRVDKMTMANSIESRVPFLDEDVVEFALQIPSALKFRNGIAKYVLKKAAEGLVPREIIYRKKWGFCGSATSILTPALAAFAREVLAQSPIIHELFRQEQVQRLFERHAVQPRHNSFKIWNLLNLALWHRTWFGAPQRLAAA